MAEEVTLIFGNFAILIPIIPIVASFIVLFIGKYYDKKAHGNLIALLATGGSFILTLLVSGDHYKYEHLPKYEQTHQVLNQLLVQPSV